jgi:hypothetical protein
MFTEDMANPGALVFLLLYLLKLSVKSGKESTRTPEPLFGHIGDEIFLKGKESTLGFNEATVHIAAAVIG